MHELPNIILITSDQQRTDSLGCYGSSWMQTPHLDALGKSGVICSRAYCSNPVCTPSRASILSGQQVSRHGAWNVGTSVPDDLPFLSHILRDAGYRTHHIGKAHFQPYMATPEQSIESLAGWRARDHDWHGPYFGFDTVEMALGHTTFGVAGHYGTWVREQVSDAEFQGFSTARQRGSTHFGCNACDWTLPHALHNSVWTAERAAAFLGSPDAAQPFFLNIGFQDPHHPHCLPNDYARRLSPADVPLPEYSAGELDDKPPHFRAAHEGRLESAPSRGDYWMAGQGAGFDFRLVSEHDAREGRAYYYRMCELMDEQIGRILNALDDNGLADNTLVIFTTDHGELLGDHGIWSKGPFHYEPMVNVPLLLRWPRGFDGRQSTPSLLSLCDLAPTVLAACSIEAPVPMDGVDALPLLRGEVTAVRDHALIECIDDPRKLRLKTLVTPTRKLTWYAGQTYGELYDLEADPMEKINRWDDGIYSDDKSALLAQLLNQMETLERRAPRWCYA